MAPQIGGGYVPHSQIQMQSQPFVSNSSHAIPPPSTSMVLRRSSSSSEEEEDEEDGDKTITPMGEVRNLFCFTSTNPISTEKLVFQLKNPGVSQKAEVFILN